MSNGEGHGGVLLDEKHCRPLLIDLHNDVPHLLDQQRRQSQRGLIEYQQLWVLHQSPTDGEHLLLTAIG